MDSIHIDIMAWIMLFLIGLKFFFDYVRGRIDSKELKQRIRVPWAVSLVELIQFVYIWVTHERIGLIFFIILICISMFLFKIIIK